MKLQNTIKSEIIFKGVGLHSGKIAKVKVCPAPPNFGIAFRRVDIPDSPQIKTNVNFVIFDDLFRRTTIGLGDIRINTIEHFLAVCTALSIDNLFIEIDTDEFPFFDGSAQEILSKFLEAGVKTQDSEKKYLIPAKPVSYKIGEVEISVIPSNSLILTMWVEYKNSFVGFQYFSGEITPEFFEKEIAPARTFGFVEEIESLRKAGLIKGGSLENALVFGEQGLINNIPLRYENEVVRHKILDFLGDLSLIGIPFKGHYTAVKSGHKYHIEFVRELLNSLDKGV